MLTLQDLETKLGMLEHQAKASGDAYAKAVEDLKQQLANHNALEGAVMLARQMVAEEKIKEENTLPEGDIPAE